MPGRGAAAKPEKPRAAFGKKQFDNTRNASASGQARAGLGSYSQAHGTITSSGLAALRQNKWWCRWQVAVSYWLVTPRISCWAVRSRVNSSLSLIPPNLNPKITWYHNIVSKTWKWSIEVINEYLIKGHYIQVYLAGVIRPIKIMLWLFTKLSSILLLHLMLYKFYSVLHTLSFHHFIFPSNVISDVVFCQNI